MATARPQLIAAHEIAALDEHCRMRRRSAARESRGDISMPSRYPLILAAAALAALPIAASASSPDAWAEFNEDMKTKCAAAAKEEFRRVQVVVDPTGSETYGMALVYGRLKGETKARGSAICVMDKKSGKVEFGTVLGTDVVRVARPKPAKTDDANAGASKKPAAAADDGESDAE
jgi:hypothetical protein